MADFRNPPKSSTEGGTLRYIVDTPSICLGPKKHWYSHCSIQNQLCFKDSLERPFVPFSLRTGVLC